MQFKKTKTQLMSKISLLCHKIHFGAVGAVQVQFKKAKYSTDVEDFCVSVEFGAVGAVGAVKFQTL